MDLEHALVNECIPYIDFLLTPSITVHQCSTPEVSHISLLLLSIPRLCPNLQNLRVYGKLPDNLALDLAFFEATCGMHNLHTLNLGSSKPPDGMISRILHHLGSLTSLETLQSLYILTEIQPFAMVNHSFPKLRNLSLILQDFDSAALIMDSMHLPFLSLGFYFTHRLPRPPSPRKLLQSLARNPHLPLSLSSIAIHGVLTKRSSVPGVDGAETASIFQPLLALVSLQTLSLRWLSGVETLDDARLNRASKSFPQLQNLTLYGRVLERKRITLAGYVPLVQNCPRLGTIAVATACKSFDPRKALPAGLCNEHLQRLDWRESSIESPVASIFRCLNIMFPNLSLLVIPSNFSSEGARKSWTDLQRLVRDSQTY